MSQQLHPRFGRTITVCWRNYLICCTWFHGLWHFTHLHFYFVFCLKSGNITDQPVWLSSTLVSPHFTKNHISSLQTPLSPNTQHIETILLGMDQMAHLIQVILLNVAYTRTYGVKLADSSCWQWLIPRHLVWNLSISVAVWWQVRTLEH